MLVFLCLVVIARLWWLLHHVSERILYRGPAYATYNNMPNMAEHCCQVYVVLPREVSGLSGPMLAELPKASCEAMFAGNRFLSVVVGVLVVKGTFSGVRTYITYT